jgi:acetylornithine/N-succinyldiaminopimelate aminotransferase
MSELNTIEIEDKHNPPFFTKIPISIERGKGVFVWDESGKRYFDFTSGWGVTCLGHAHPVIREALTEQSAKIMQGPCSGLTYSPARARLLELMCRILPANLNRVFFSNSGAEANDAAIKLARKVSGRLDVISTNKSFHGRTISTASATGQAKHREKFNPLMPNYRFVPFDDVDAVAGALDADVAAVILEPIQGEGGVHVPQQGYLREVSRLCRTNQSLLIVDEVQTGFCRTGQMFAIDTMDAQVDFLTMAKGIAGGFPFGAFALSEEVASKLEKGDHGGTYCGNPLGCAVAYAVIRYLLDQNIGENVDVMGSIALEKMKLWAERLPQVVRSVRGKGLLMAMEIVDADTASAIHQQCLDRGLMLNVTQGNIIRLFPALTITEDEMNAGLEIIEQALIAAGN